MVTLSFNMQIPDAVTLGQPLQLAVEAAFAGQAFKRVVGEKKLQNLLSCRQHFRGIGVDHHPVLGGQHAGGIKSGAPLYLDNADAAGCRCVEVFQIAKSGDIYPGLPRRLQDGGSLLNGDLLVVYCQCDHTLTASFRFRPPLMASKGHSCAQSLQSTHFSGSMRYRPSSWIIASAGHSRAQSPQARHFSS